MTRVTGKTALITGAGRGIGRAVALRLGLEGAKVFVTDIDEGNVEEVAKIIEEGGGKAVPLRLDVTSQSDWDSVASGCDRLDILVHNAGVELLKPFEGIQLEDWRKTQQVNVESVLLGTSALLPGLKAGGAALASGASVVIMSSVMAMVAVPGQAAYNTSKGALRQMAKAMAIEFAVNGWNIRVNSVHPGVIETDMAEEIFETWGKAGTLGTSDVEEIKQAVAKSHPLGRLGKPEDIAAGVLYLASDDAGYVTGSELVIDGGWTAQ